MMKWDVYATVLGSKFLGTFEAKDQEEAEKLALKANGSVNLCHECNRECEDAEIGEVKVELNTQGEQ